MRSEVGDRVVEAAPQVLHQRFCDVLIVVKRHGFIKYAEISGLFYVGIGSGNQPQRIIIEAASDCQISTLGQRLVLVVGTTVRELCCSDIKDSFACALGDHVDKAQKVLTAVPETHSAAHSAFEVGSASAHVEGHHTLVLVPDVDHAVQLLVIAFYLDLAQKTVPVFFKFFLCFFDLLVCVVAFYHFLGSGAVDQAKAFPFLVLWILDVVQAEGDGVFLIGLEGDVQLVCSAGPPAIGNGVGKLSILYCIRHCRASIGAVETVHGGVESVDLSGAPEDCIVVAPFAVFGLVVDG